MGRLVGFVDLCNVREFLDLLMGFGIFIKLDIFEPYVYVIENGEIVRSKLQLFVFLGRLVRLFDNIEEFLDLLLGFRRISYLCTYMTKFLDLLLVFILLNYILVYFVYTLADQIFRQT